jgi:hypothetical protein
MRPEVQGAQDAPAALASEPFDALPDELISASPARESVRGVTDAVPTDIPIAEVSTTVDPASAYDSVTSVSRPQEEHHDGWLHLLTDHCGDAT